MIKNNYLRCIFTASLLLAAHAAWAQKDAALVTTVSGDATYQATGQRAMPVQSFMKLRDGDRAEVRPNGQLNLVYLQSGEVEQWDGPANFVVGETRTLKIIAGTPVTRKLPMAMVERIARAPEVVTDIRNRSGVTVTRSMGSPAAAEARRNYKEARELLPAHDITPELDLFIVLYQERQYGQANTVLQEMQKRAPDDPVVNELAQRLERALRLE